MVPTDSAAFERLRKEAKRFLIDLHREDEAAIRRYARCWPPTAATNEARTLARVQLVIAREHGYRSWTHLKTSLLAQEGEGKMDQVVSKFFQDLVFMLDAGRPLFSSLREMESSETTAPALRPVVHQLAEDIATGSSFSAALAKHPTVFDPGYMAMLTLFENEMRKAGGPVNEAPAP